MKNREIASKMILALFLVNMLAFALALQIQAKASPESGWLDGWRYRRSHVIGSALGAETGYQVKIRAHYGSGTDGGEDIYLNHHCRMDFGDVRFTEGDGISGLDYWLEVKVDGNHAVFWVEITGNLSFQSQLMYVYYGNEEATTTSSGQETFPDLFDHFNDGFLDPSVWTTVVDASESGTSAKIGDSANDYDEISTDSTVFTRGRAIRSCVKITNSITLGYVGLRVMGDGSVGSRDQILNGMDWQDETHVGMYYIVDSGVFSIVRYNGDPRGQFYIYEIQWESDRLGFYANGYEQERTSNLPNDNAFNVRFVQYDANQYTYVDWVLVRNYVNPEPTHGSWGVEEELTSILLTVKLSGELDYAYREEIPVRLSALVTDSQTREPVSDCNVTVEIYKPEGKLWISDNMTENLHRAGIYEWVSKETLNELDLEKGVYLVCVMASYQDGPTAIDILDFHVDPPFEAPAQLETFLLFAMIGVLGILVSAWCMDHRRLVRKQQ